MSKATELRLLLNVHPPPIKTSHSLIEDTREGWRQRFELITQQQANQPGPPYTSKSGRVYFQNNWEPVVVCPYEKRIGKAGDGGKWVCNPRDISRPALVYSIGSHNQFDFEEEIYTVLGEEVCLLFLPRHTCIYMCIGSR